MCSISHPKTAICQSQQKFAFLFKMCIMDLPEGVNLEVGMKNNIKEAAQKAHAKRAAWIVSQYEKKGLMEPIAEALGISRTRVGQILKEAGVQTRRGRK